MTRPTARVLALLEILQNGGTHTAADLATRLAVDERTVRRYADHLLDLDVPVEAVRGRYGGYRLAPGFRMPPLMLTDEEALAVLLGLVAGGPSGLREAAGSAAAKVRRVLPKTLAARLDTLLASVTPPETPAPAPESSIMLRLAEATRLRRPALITYADRTGRSSERILHPYGVVARSGRWYVTGADSASGETRTFRLDRIAAARILPGAFTVPAGFDPAGEVSTGLATTPWRHRVVVAVRGTPAETPARLPRGLATIDPDPGHPDWVLVRLRAERLDWLPAVLAGLGRPFVVKEPPELRTLTQTWATRVAASAAATSESDADGTAVGGQVVGEAGGSVVGDYAVDQGPDQHLGPLGEMGPAGGQVGAGAVPAEGVGDRDRRGPGRGSPVEGPVDDGRGQAVGEEDVAGEVAVDGLGAQGYRAAGGQQRLEQVQRRE
jgi:predicted DNA-binding transcriptional regulator YafY